MTPLINDTDQIVDRRLAKYDTYDGPEKRRKFKSKAVVGLRSGKLVITKILDREFKGARFVECQCDCGSVVKMRDSNVYCGLSRSCGCSRVTHGLSESSEYDIYISARNRCQNPANPNFDKYGERGIEFRFKSFEEFYAELGPRPSMEYSLDRINNGGHYETGNVRWADRTTQAQNTRANKFHETSDGFLCQADIARDLGVARGTISSRFKAGWCKQCATTLPSQRFKPNTCTHRDEEVVDRRKEQLPYDGASRRHDTALAAHIALLSANAKEQTDAANETRQAAGKARDALDGLMLSSVGLIFLAVLLLSEQEGALDELMLSIVGLIFLAILLLSEQEMLWQ